MSSSEVDKAEVTNKWDNDGHMKLCVALNEALIAADSSAAKQSEVIMASFAASNATFTWEGVR
ncbi:hypothetical protein HMPREF1624_08532 [Sporothrix schenckii ATCC 58251]|uniref:Uncharacterized protein n=1 Tax=Sporothrix schenckii (strain ATCC 58251 / de Perez 2211183) TaxID=1391915 RepID=U7PHI5_SPOS1|nr:hypothetical protein HMPREF1624_08532 [Sporothrix schenckii ATCC 58251]